MARAALKGRILPDANCEHCGTPAGEQDLFCRNCGQALHAGQTAQPESPAAQARRPGRGFCLFAAAGLVFFILILAVGLMIFIASQPGGLSTLAVELVGTQTPYPTQYPLLTRTPYRTQTAYRLSTLFRTPTLYHTPTVYTTQLPYPTTGPIRGRPKETPYRVVLPPSSLTGGCRIKVINQADVDSVVLVINAENENLISSVYVRAGESYNRTGYSTGTFYVYVAEGLDWDYFSERFTTNAVYYRFEELFEFISCSRFYGSYQYLDLILHVREKTGEAVNFVPEDFFPNLTR